MAIGHFALVLHAHLPWVRHPEHPRSLEERWLFEAMAESYLPLLAAFARLGRDGVRFALTMSITPPLAAMLRDRTLPERFFAHLARVERVARGQRARGHAEPGLAAAVDASLEHLDAARSTFEAIDRDVVGAFVEHARRGDVELVASAATHAYLPGLLPCRSSLRAQLRLGMRAARSLGGPAPRGFWLPECAYDPAFDDDLADAGVGYAVLETHGVTHASPRPPFGTSAPILSPAGVAFFGRDVASSRQVWSREVGYPGDPDYREFHSDVGFERPESELFGELGPNGERIATGVKLHRVTGPGREKLAYDPTRAAARARAHAASFVAARRADALAAASRAPAPVAIVAPYDAELFGHWWFEGPLFVEHVFRELHREAAAPERALRPVTLGAHLDAAPELVRATPAASSWGEGGHGAVWVGRDSARLARHVHHAARLVEGLLARDAGARGERAEVVAQAIRELLLLEASDWPFLVSAGTTRAYALARVRAHAERLRRLATICEIPRLSDDDRAWLGRLAASDGLFADVDLAALASAFAPPAPQSR